jgi:hypothetical protein
MEKGNSAFFMSRRKGGALVFVMVVGFVFATMAVYLSTNQLAVTRQIERSIPKALELNVQNKFQGYQNQFQNTSSVRLLEILSCADPCFQRCYFSDMNDANYPMPGGGWETAQVDDTNPRLPADLQGNCLSMVGNTTGCPNCDDLKDSGANRGNFYPLRLPNPNDYSEEIAGFYTKSLELCRGTTLNGGVTWPNSDLADLVSSGVSWGERFHDWEQDELVGGGLCRIMVTTFWRYAEGCDNMIVGNCGIDITYDYHFFNAPDQVWKDLAP